MDAVTEFYRSQIGGTSVINYAYTDMPTRLLVKDIYYFFVYSWALPRVLSPIGLWASGELAELYPSWPNLFCVLVHVILAVFQLFFILALPLAVLLPIWAAAGAVAVFLLLNWLLCKLLNGPGFIFHSDAKYARERPEHAHEQWVFLNGVTIGEHWMKSNLNRLALTFGRPVMGIHNRTSGMLFDIIECLIQRNFTYATADVRLCFKTLRNVLYDPSKSKVVFILHSQGGIEGGLVLDWLLQEMPQDLLAKLEVYTFGNAANHFNNPHRHALSQSLTQSKPLLAINTFLTESGFASPASSPTEVKNGFTTQDPATPLREPSLPVSRTLSAAKDRAIGHIEHYAHSTDFVALWGVLHFATNKMGSPQLPRFLGRLFQRSTGRGGHLLNQHYLDGMFPLKRDPETGEFVGADDENEFMEEIIRLGHEDVAMDKTREAFDIAYVGTRDPDASDASLPMANTRRAEKKVKVKELSRLWSYRNGRSPPGKPPMLQVEDGVVRMATL
ncbi:alpha/beta-Hydrolase [Hirsutella rhossiliensis]|uniref:Alpha/beta-Hydrolase n=1 Tax=Hirsutella rhossiliensis TaxID=111463 RepID=A0A9P8MZQ8_9HYPO|nr:alpha/beta-Hydrolase [Hirsutella rhossiliensis]KAH0965453.1 alpha/beta-Hydrolase [Hirsutella rhossiliensis]